MKRGTAEKEGGGVSGGKEGFKQYLRDERPDP